MTDSYLTQFLVGLLDKYSRCKSYHATGQYFERSDSLEFDISYLRDEAFCITWSSSSAESHTSTSSNPNMVWLDRTSGVNYREAKTGDVTPVTQKVFSVQDSSFLQLVGNTTFGLLSGKRTITVLDDSKNFENPSSLVQKEQLLETTYEDVGQELLFKFNMFDLTVTEVMLKTKISADAVSQSNDARARLGFPPSPRVSGYTCEELGLFTSVSFNSLSAIPVPHQYKSKL